MEKLVLIIDDEKELVEYLQELLNELKPDIKIIPAYGGVEGIEKLEEHVADLNSVFLDMMMPDINGMIVYEKIRELSKDLKVVLMSGFPLAELSNDPYVFFLHKRFGLKNVENILKRMVEVE